MNVSGKHEVAVGLAAIGQNRHVRRASIPHAELGSGVDEGLEHARSSKARARLHRRSVAQPEAEHVSVFVAHERRVQDALFAVRVHPQVDTIVGSASIVRWASLQKDFPGVKAVNRGFGGSELADSVFYADRIVIPYQPRIVVLYAGENDLNAGKSPETVFGDFKAFVAKVHAALPRTRIVFIAIKPSPSRVKIKDHVVRANDLIAAACARDPRLAFADVYTPMLTITGEMRPELFVKDMLHLNEAGYAVWTPVVARYLR